MKGLLISLLASVSVNALALPSTPAKKVCTTVETTAAAAIEQTKERYMLGEATRADLYLSEIEYLNAQLECGSIIRGDFINPYGYCSQKNWYKITTLVDDLQAELRLGDRSPAEISKAESIRDTFLTICE